jgi:hypothetical protein
MQRRDFTFPASRLDSTVASESCGEARDYPRNLLSGKGLLCVGKCVP